MDEKIKSPYEKVMERHARETHVRYTSNAATPDQLRQQLIERFEISRSSAMNRLASYEESKVPKYLKVQAKEEAAIYERELYFLAKLEFVSKEMG
jgi:hypothetical protein